MLQVARLGLDRGEASGVQQRQQSALLIQGDEVIAAAYVGVTNEDLRHGTAPGDVHHVRPLNRVEVDADFFNLAHPTLLQQGLARWQYGQTSVVYILTDCMAWK